MISVNDLQNISKELNLELVKDINFWNLIIKDSLFDVGESVVLEINFKTKRIWFYNDLKYFENTFLTKSYWNLAVNEKTNEDLKKKTKEFFIKELNNVLKKIKLKKIELAIEKINGDFK